MRPQLHRLHPSQYVEINAARLQLGETLPEDSVNDREEWLPRTEPRVGWETLSGQGEAPAYRNDEEYAASEIVQLGLAGSTRQLVAHLCDVARGVRERV